MSNTHNVVEELRKCQIENVQLKTKVKQLENDIEIIKAQYQSQIQSLSQKIHILTEGTKENSVPTRLKSSLKTKEVNTVVNMETKAKQNKEQISITLSLPIDGLIYALQNDNEGYLETELDNGLDPNTIVSLEKHSIRYH
jgi:predicted RNase H-like nuclease (RuvC/YqgF family)